MPGHAHGHMHTYDACMHGAYDYCGIPEEVRGGVIAYIDGEVGEAGREGGREATRVYDVCDAEPS